MVPSASVSSGSGVAPLIKLLMSSDTDVQGRKQHRWSLGCHHYLPSDGRPHRRTKEMTMSQMREGSEGGEAPVEPPEFFQ